MKKDIFYIPNKDQNYEVQVFDGEDWHTVGCEYNFTASTSLARNIHLASGANTRVRSKKSDTILFQAEHENK